MKKMICTILCVLLGMGLLSGCGTSLEGEESVVYVDKKGAVTSLDVEEFQADIYDETELEAFVDDAVEAYNEEHGKNTVKVQELSVLDGIARLKMKYKSPGDYTGLKGIELYHGKVVDSLAAGYVYDGDFARIEEGAVAGPATKQDIYGGGDLKVVIIRANTNVRVDGEICYVSCDNVKLTGTDSVSIREGYALETGAAEAVAETGGTEAAEQTDGGSAAVTDGSFETDVYTFIVYK